MSIECVAKVWKMRLSGPDLVVMHCLADCANPHGRRIFPSVDYVAWACGLSSRTVQRTLKRLVAAGFLTIARPPRRSRPTEYAIAWDAVQWKEDWDGSKQRKGRDDNPSPEHPHSGDNPSPQTTPPTGDNPSPEPDRSGDNGCTVGVTTTPLTGDTAVAYKPSYEPSIEPSSSSSSTVLQSLPPDADADDDPLTFLDEKNQTYAPDISEALRRFPPGQTLAFCRHAWSGKHRGPLPAGALRKLYTRHGRARLYAAALIAGQQADRPFQYMRTVLASFGSPTAPAKAAAPRIRRVPAYTLAEALDQLDDGQALTDHFEPAPCMGDGGANFWKRKTPKPP